MLPVEIAVETVTRLRGVESTNTHGDTRVSWDTPWSAEISGCSVQPAPGSEYLLGRDSVTSRWEWFGPEDADVRSDDRIVHKGVTYEIDGSVQEWTDPLQEFSHKFCFLQRVEG